MICSQCNTENQPGDRFCLECGAPLTALEPDTQSGGVLMRLGPDGGEAHSLGSRVVIGRLETCDLPVPDKSVSREHARLTRVNGSYVVEDLGSTNGTMVNGTRIYEATQLQPGDVVSVGAIDFRFETADPMAQPVAAAAWHASENEGADMASLYNTMPAAFAPFESFTAGSVEDETRESATAWPTVEATPVEQHNGNGTETPAEAVPADSWQPAAAPEETSVDPAPADSWQQSADDAAASWQPAATASAPSFDEALEAADHLKGLLHDLSGQVAMATAQLGRLAEVEQRLAETESRLASSEAQVAAAGRQRSAVESALQQVPERAMSEEQVETVKELLSALVESPRDIEVLMKIAQQAADLAAVVQGYDELRGILQTVSEALDAPSAA